MHFTCLKKKVHVMLQRRRESPTLSGGSTPTGLPNDWPIGCIEPEMTDSYYELVALVYTTPTHLD